MSHDQCSTLRLHRPGLLRHSRAAVARGGFTLVEMFATFAVLGAAIALTTPLLVSVSRQRQGIEQRQFAVQHATNILERFSARSWSDLPTGPQILPDAPADLQTLLPDLKQTLAIKEVAEKPMARQLTVLVSWSGPSGVIAKPVQLSAWIFQPEEQ